DQPARVRAHALQSPGRNPDSDGAFQQHAARGRIGSAQVPDPGPPTPVVDLLGVDFVEGRQDPATVGTKGNRRGDWATGPTRRPEAWQKPPEPPFASGGGPGLRVPTCPRFRRSPRPRAPGRSD